MTQRFVVHNAEARLAWELRGAMAMRREVRLTLSSRCDGVRLNEDGERVLQGRVTRVSPTDAYCVMHGRHVPIAEILSVVRPHFTQSAASDPREPDP